MKFYKYTDDIKELKKFLKIELIKGEYYISNSLEKENPLICKIRWNSEIQMPTIDVFRPKSNRREALSNYLGIFSVGLLEGRKLLMKFKKVK